MRSPRSSSSQVTPYSSAMAGKRDMSGEDAPVSQLLTVLLETPSLSAASCCVIPLDFRKIARNSPIVVFAIAFSFGCAARAPRHECSRSPFVLYNCGRGTRHACCVYTAARIAARRFSSCPFFASILSDSENFCNPRPRKIAPRTLEFLSNAGIAPQKNNFVLKKSAGKKACALFESYYNIIGATARLRFSRARARG